MPVPWAFVGSVLVLSTEGDYTKAELESAIALATADPRFAPGTPLLLDSRLSTAVPSSADVQWRIAWAGSLQRRGFSSRIGILTRDEPFRVGIGQQIAASVESRGIAMRVFRDEEAALAWVTGRAAAS